MGRFSLWQRFSSICATSLAPALRPLALRLRGFVPAEWYLHPSVDYYVFVIFSWGVWAPLVTSWGAYGLARAANGLNAYWSLVPHFSSWRWAVYLEWLADPKFQLSLPLFGGLANPHADLDLTVSTDSEDLAIFAADVLEFAEQDATLLTDALFDLGGGTFIIGGALLWLGRRTLPSALARRRRK